MSLKTDCITGCVIHEHVTTVQIGSDDIEMTKNPWTTMSISFNIYASWTYWSCCQNWSQNCLWRAKRAFHFHLRTAQVTYLCDPKKIFLQMKNRSVWLYRINITTRASRKIPIGFWSMASPGLGGAKVPHSSWLPLNTATVFLTWVFRRLHRFSLLFLLTI